MSDTSTSMHAASTRSISLSSSQKSLGCLSAQAVSASMTEGDLQADSATVGFVGADSSFTILSEADLEPHVAALKDAEDAPAGLWQP